ncbi:MAG TPA: hypothetical protein VM491_16915, partial [Burkholderiaceae bacterium]|nr:hypothetical protein [Burkholderiaceae bacterium]
MAAYADAIAARTGIGQAAVGMLLLGAVTSLPEASVSSTAALRGNAELAVNNLIGSVTIQIVALALADALVKRDAISSLVVQPVVLLQLASNILLYALLALAAAFGDVPLAGAGVGTWLLFACFVGTLWVISRERGPAP